MRSDEEARLVELWSDDVRRLVARSAGPRLRRTRSVSDLCQDAFLRFFRGLDPGAATQPTEDLRRRLLRNARWVVLDAARAAGAEHGESAAGDGAVARVADRDSGGDDGPVTLQDQERWVHRLIERLDERDARILRLRLKRVPYADIADQLGMTADAARKRHELAVRALATRIRVEES